MKTAIWSVVSVALLACSASALTAPSASITGEPSYTISNEGVRMLYVDPYECKQPATSLSTWVIELDQPETVQSIQVSVVEGTLNEEEGALENIVVRVGDNNPLEAGLSSNSLCTLAGVNASSSMISYKCQAPVSGLFISISRNDAGSMNVCAFSANLGTTAFAPNFALGPFIAVPASELMIPKSPEQAYNGAEEIPQPVAEVPTTAEQLPVLESGSPLKTFLALDGSLTPAPGPGPMLAPMSADEPTALPVFSAASDEDEDDDEAVNTPAPAPAPMETPDMAPVGLPVFAATDSGAESVSEVEAPVPAPVPSPVLAPEALPVFAATDSGAESVSEVEAPVPAPVPSPMLAPEALPVFAATDSGVEEPSADSPTPAPAPVPAPATDASSVFAAVQTPILAPAPAPGPMAPTPAEEAQPLISPSSPLVDNLGVTPTPALPKQNFATQTPPTSASPSDASGRTTSSHSGLSGGAIAGIVIGCAVGVALIAAIALYVTRHTDLGGRRFTSHV